MNYPMKRDLDGVYFRVSRGGKWENVCFSDLTETERIEVMRDRSPEWLRNMCHLMADTVRAIGDDFNIIGK